MWPGHGLLRQAKSWEVHYLWNITFLTQLSTSSAKSGCSGLECHRPYQRDVKHYCTCFLVYSEHWNVSVPHVLSTTNFFLINVFRNSYNFYNTVNWIENRTPITCCLYCFLRDLLILKDEDIGCLIQQGVRSRLTVLEQLQSSLMRCAWELPRMPPAGWTLPLALPSQGICLEFDVRWIPSQLLSMH